MGVHKGEPWETRGAGATPVRTVTGDDRALADAIAAGPPGVRVAWRPDRSADFARVVGLAPTAPSTGSGGDLRCDAIEIDTSRVERVAVNLLVVGTAPDRQHRFTRSVGLRVVVDGRVVHDGPAAAVVVANGQFLRGRDVVPRGHPGDGRLEVQVYAIRGRERAAMRRRLARGDHLPHPAIRQVGGRDVEITATGPRPRIEIDGRATGPGLAAGASLRARVRPGAFVLAT